MSNFRIINPLARLRAFKFASQVGAVRKQAGIILFHAAN